MKFLEIFGENWLNFVRKYKIIRIWRIISMRHWKVSKGNAKYCAFGPEKTKLLKIFRKIDILHNFSRNKFFTDLCPLLGKYYLWKIKFPIEKEIYKSTIRLNILMIFRCLNRGNDSIPKSSWGYLPNPVRFWVRDEVLKASFWGKGWALGKNSMSACVSYYNYAIQKLNRRMHMHMPFLCFYL